MHLPATRLHMSLTALFGTLCTAGAFLFACQQELSSRERVFGLQATHYLDLTGRRMAGLSRSLRVLATLPLSARDSEPSAGEAVGAILQGAPNIAAFVSSLYETRLSAAFLIVDSAGQGGTLAPDDPCRAAIERLVAGAGHPGTVAASETCPLRQGETQERGFALVLSAAQSGRQAPDLPLVQLPRKVAAALIRTTSLFAPPTQTGLPDNADQFASIAVYAGHSVDGSSALFRQVVHSAAPGWVDVLCDRACRGTRLSRTVRWAEKEWHLVLTGRPFGVHDLPPSAFGFLFIGLLATLAALWYVGARGRVARKVGALVALRTRELGSLNALLMADIEERSKVAKELSESRQRLRELGDYNARIKEEERKRIAREIHDDLGQNMLALKIDLTLMQQSDPSQITRERIQAAIGQIDITLTSMRMIINELRPAVLDLGIGAAIQWEAAKFERRTGVSCSVTLPEDMPATPDDAATALYRIVQESLTNIMRHARASHVWIDLWIAQDWMFMTLADNGVGMAQGCRRKTKSFGLIGMAERVYALGGAFDTDSTEGAGTKLTVALPLTPVSRAAPARRSEAIA